MKIYVYSFIIIILCLVSSSFTLYSGNSNVVILTEENFNEKVINSNELWLVEFFAPWCGHCKNLAPEWEKAANVLKGIVKVGAVDADTYKQLGGKYGIRGFPTIKWFGLQKGNPKDYEQGRTANDIVKFAVAKIQEITNARLNGSSSGQKQEKQSEKKQQNTNTNTGGSDKDVIVLNDSNFDSILMKSNDMWLVEFYAPWCGHCKKLEPEWNKVATELKGKIKVAKVDATENSQLGSKFDIKGYPTIKIFPPGDKKVNKEENYEGGRDASMIVTSALEKLEKYGFIPDIDQLTNHEQYTTDCIESGKTCILAFMPNIYESSAKERNRYIEVLKKASTLGNGKPLKFLWVQGADNFEYEEKFGLQFGFPAILVVNHSKKKYTTMKMAFDLENIKTFINRILIARESFYDFPAAIPKIKKVSQWDGKDAVLEKNEDL